MSRPFSGDAERSHALRSASPLNGPSDAGMFREATGFQRRSFVAEVAVRLCGGSARKAERRFGWGRGTVEEGLHEGSQGIRCVEDFSARGQPRGEEADPRLAADIRAFVEPFTQADPELKSSRQYTNVSAAEVRRALVDKGHDPLALPASEPCGTSSTA